MGLSESHRAQLIDLLVERQAGLIQPQREARPSPLASDATALLGARDGRRFMSLLRTAPSRARIHELALTMDRAGVPLRAEQRRELVEALHQRTQALPAPSDDQLGQLDFARQLSEHREREEWALRECVLDLLDEEQRSFYLRQAALSIAFSRDA